MDLEAKAEKTVMDFFRQAKKGKNYIVVYGGNDSQRGIVADLLGKHAFNYFIFCRLEGEEDAYNVDAAAFTQAAA